MLYQEREKEMNKFEIVSGKCFEGQIHNSKYAGNAIYQVDDDYYKVRLNLFPTITYFVRKNKDHLTYTIFSKMVKTNEGLKFVNPVGMAKIKEDLKTYMAIKFELLNASLYMSLFPAE